MKALVLAVVLAAIPTPQTSTVAGVWTGEFNGKTFAKVELHVSGTTFTGTVDLGDVQVDEKGDLREVGSLHNEGRPIFDVAQQGATVTFSAKDGDDTDQFDFRVRNDGRAELRYVPTAAFLAELAAHGVPAPKPFFLTRQPH